MRVSVVIPTYKRPDSLINCVASVRGSDRLPNEILIAFRDTDRRTEEVVAGLQGEGGIPIVPVRVTVPGHVPPVEAAVRRATGEIMAIIDDDITVPPGWLDRVVRHFDDPSVGAVGGGNIVPGAPIVAPKKDAGQVSWVGRHSGNIAHVREGGVREVATVMECNWAWRRDLLASLDFDPVLNFDDASMYGLDLCLQAKRKGFRTLYDPEAAALHHMAPRDPALDRADRPRRAFSYGRNYTYIMLRQLSWGRRLPFLLWWFLVGERGATGVATALWDRIVERRDTGAPALALSTGAKFEGLRLWLQGGKRRERQRDGRNA